MPVGIRPAIRSGIKPGIRSMFRGTPASSVIALADFTASNGTDYTADSTAVASDGTEYTLDTTAVSSDGTDYELT